MKNKTVRAIAFSQGKNSPSSRFRVHQVCEHINKNQLSDLSVDVSIAKYSSYPPVQRIQRLGWGINCLLDNIARARESSQYDVCFLHREMLSTMYTTERLIKIPYIFDVDDAIWHTARFDAIKKITNRASAVIAGNNYIAEKLSGWCETIYVVPTAVNTKRFVESDSLNEKIIVWSGSSGGLHYLYKIEKALYEVLKNKPDWKLRVVSDKLPQFKHLSNSMFEYIEWSASSEVESVNTCSIGIMPLEDNEWEHAKCSYKMLTYMSCGLPVIVSPVGMNSDVLRLKNSGFGPASNKEWIDNLICLIDDKSYREKLGRAGRSVIEENFSLDIIAPRVADILVRNAR